MNGKTLDTAKAKEMLSETLIKAYVQGDAAEIKAKDGTCESAYGECEHAMGPLLDEWRADCFEKSTFISPIDFNDCDKNEVMVRKINILTRVADMSVNSAIAMQSEGPGKGLMSNEELNLAVSLAARVSAQIPFSSSFVNMALLLDFFRGTDSADTIIYAAAGDAFENQMKEIEFAFESARLVNEIAAIESTRLIDMDIDGDGSPTLEEALAFALTREDWVKYRPMLEKFGLNHPIDIDRFSPQVLQRIHDIAFEVESELGIERDAQGFCEAFIPAFIEAGEASFKKGGLCLSYPEESAMPLLEEHEMTASESFEGCVDPQREYGTCTEMTYKVIGAIKAAGIQCDVASMTTENHAYPAFDGVSLDPSGIGEIGWSEETNPVAMYLYNAIRNDPNNTLLDQIASLLEPKAFVNHSATNAMVTYIKYAYEDEKNPIPKAALIDKFLALFDDVVVNNPKTILPFNTLSGRMKDLPQAARLDVGLACISRWPENPYAFLPLNTAISYDEDAVAANKGDQDALYRLEQKEKTIADRIRTQIDEPLLANSRRATGHADLILIQIALGRGRDKEAVEFARRALAKNPDNAIAHQALANLYVNQLRFDESVSELEKAISAAPNLSGNHLLLAKIAQNRGDLEKASSEAEKEAIVFSGNMDAASLAVNLENMRGQPKKALELLNLYFPSEYLDSASKAGFETAAFVYSNFKIEQTAGAYRTMGRYDEARRLYAELGKRIGDSPALTQNLIGLELEAGDINAAKALYAGSAEKMDSLTRHMIDADIAYFENDIKKLEDEIEAFKAMPGIEPTLIDSLVMSHANMNGDLKKVREIASARVKKNPEDSLARAALLMIDIEEGRTIEARQGFETLKREFPDVFAIKTIEPSLLLREEKYSNALQASEKMLKNGSSNSYLLAIKALSLIKIGRPKKALDIGKRLSEQIPKSGLGTFIMSRALLEMGRPEKAKELLPEIKRLDNYDLESWPLWSSKALEKEIEAALAGR